MRGDYHLFRALKDEPNGRQGTVDTMGLSDLASIDRHVKVHAQENNPVPELQVGEFSNHKNPRIVLF
jgi:hypothetical protein